jgi:chromosome segregation ATPase
MKQSMNGRGPETLRPGGFAFWAGIACFCVFSACWAWGQDEWRPRLDAGDRSTLSVGYQEKWVHEDGSPAEEEQWATLGEEALEKLAEKPDFDARKAALEGADEATLEAARAESEERIGELTRSLPTVQRDIRRLKVQALTESPKAKEIRQKIKDLEEELEAYAEGLPEVQARRAAIEAINRNLLDELKFRRELGGLLGGGGTGKAQPTLEP